MDFYGNKPKDMPRHIYKILSGLHQSGQYNDDQLLDYFKNLLNKSKNPDYLKFAWVLPEKYKSSLGSNLSSKLEILLKEKRRRKPGQIKRHVFPHVSEEFSLDQTFLEEVLDRKRLPEFTDEDRVFSIGSCFARNFANFLVSKNIVAKNYSQAEDINSPGSNSLLLNFAKLPLNEVEKNLNALIDHYWGRDLNEAQIEAVKKIKLQEISNLNSQITKATKIIITLGNVVDFYSNVEGKQVLAPKFIALSETEDINERSTFYNRLLKNGASIRLSNFSETKQYIQDIYSSIREMNPKCSIIFTVSPVPIDSVIGINEKLSSTAIEIDCISKSTIRAALNEFLIDDEIRSDPSLYYIPSFEIVRWIAPNSLSPIFGNEDSASRHVSNDILNAICNFSLSNSDI